MAGHGTFYRSFHCVCARPWTQLPTGAMWPLGLHTAVLYSHKVHLVFCFFCRFLIKLLALCLYWDRTVKMDRKWVGERGWAGSGNYKPVGLEPGSPLVPASLTEQTNCATAILIVLYFCISYRAAGACLGPWPLYFLLSVSVQIRFLLAQWYWLIYK